MIDMLDETSQYRLFRAFDIALKDIDPFTGATHNAQVTVDDKLDRDSLQDAFRQVERYGIKVVHVFMNIRDYSDIRNRSGPNEPMTGLVSFLWEAGIIVSPVSPEGTVYVCAGEKCMGVIGGHEYCLVNPWTVSAITVRREPVPDSYASRTDDNLLGIFG